MNTWTIVASSLALALLPCTVFLSNLLAYRPLPSTPPLRRLRRGRPASHSGFVPHDHKNPECNARFAFSYPGVSVLIPARNEENKIADTLRAVLANAYSNFEVVVLDDYSTDRTADFVQELSKHDSRVRLEQAPKLPPGWCGKQHACFTLAKLARHPLLLFIDADVRLESDALARVAWFMENRPVALASGVPRQELVTISERLLIPLIHFILLGFLPMHAMRWTRWPSMSAGCGQLFVARKDAYDACGGHAKLKDSLHDGIKLPRVFRRAGFSTDLFDATDIAGCRMYETNQQTWQGLGKNATEGLAAPRTILPITLMLLGGQVLPFVLLYSLTIWSGPWLVCWLAVIAVYLPRFVAAWKFQQPLLSAVLHPFGILGLLWIQWSALIRYLLGKPAQWKGREYHVSLRPADVHGGATL